LAIRSKQRILYGGIQLAANNMPQGELIQIPLTRYTGRQNIAHFIVHLNDCESDLGRKGFQSEIADFAKNAAAKLIDDFSKYKGSLRPTTGATSDIQREENIEVWKKEMMEHEMKEPLTIANSSFFIPTNEISITSVPTREQDVIALLSQLLAGGVIRGIKLMSTNERFTYDGLYHIIIGNIREHHVYNSSSNPLGILDEIYDSIENRPFHSSPKVIEYKYSLDGLIEDIECGNKNSNDISLIVVWETGELWKQNYKITSLVDIDNLNLRQYHGITHIMTNLTTGQKEMDLIVLKELVDYLNNPAASLDYQKKKYEEAI
jgi:hypothetical protein